MVNLSKQQIEDAYNEALSATGAARLLGVKFDTYKKYALMYGCYKKNPAGIGIIKKKPEYIETDNFNYHYFDRIDSPEKAYVLGFTASDGAPNKTYISYNLSAVDLEILEYFCDCLETNRDRIVHYKSCSVTGSSRKYFDSISLRLRSKHFLETLANYNVVPNRVKNNLDLFTKIPIKYKDAWIAGYIDGNGSISKNGNTISITSNKATCNAIVAYIKSYSENVKYRFTDHENFSELDIIDREFVIRYIYSSLFHLSRKIVKAHNILYRMVGRYTSELVKVDKGYYIPVIENTCIDCGKPIKKGAVRCKSCASIYRNKSISNKPSKDVLEQDLKCCNFLEVSRRYGVTDNAVRKWCKFYGLPYRTKELKDYFNNMPD